MCRYCDELTDGAAGRPWFDQDGNSGSLIWYPGELMPVLAVNLKARDPEACASVVVLHCPMCGAT